MTDDVYVVHIDNELQLIVRRHPVTYPRHLAWAQEYLQSLTDTFKHALPIYGVPVPLDAWLSQCEISVTTKQQLDCINKAKASLHDRITTAPDTP